MWPCNFPSGNFAPMLNPFLCTSFLNDASQLLQGYPGTFFTWGSSDILVGFTLLAAIN